MNKLETYCKEKTFNLTFKEAFEKTKVNIILVKSGYQLNKDNTPDIHIWKAVIFCCFDEFNASFFSKDSDEKGLEFNKYYQKFEEIVFYNISLHFNVNMFIRFKKNTISFDNPIDYTKKIDLINKYIFFFIRILGTPSKIIVNFIIKCLKKSKK